MNTHHTIRISSVLLISIAAAALLPGDARGASYHWVDTPAKYMELFHGDRPILRYMYAPVDESSEQARLETYKVFHHLYDPLGEVLLTNGPTGDSPYSKDVLYPHHRGLFYGFNRVTYGDGKKADTWHMGHGESQQQVSVLASGADATSGWHRVAIDWHGQDGAVFANEERELTVSLHEGGTRVDFVSSLQSATGGPIHLDGDPQHAGFQFRATDDVAKETKDQTYYLRTDGKGKPGETRNWDPKKPDAPQNKECTNRPWNAMSFVVGGKRLLALYMGHPDNPKPVHYSERDYGRFGSYFVHDLQPGEPLVVRYRVWVQEGELDTNSACQLHEQFVAATPPSQSLVNANRLSEDADPESTPDNTPPEGYTALFNGKDLSGWKGLVENPKARAAMGAEELVEKQEKADERMRAHWEVKDGAFVFDGKGDSLCTAKDYCDFEMYVTWKIKAKGDSGIYLRGSPQLQIWDNGTDKGSGALWNNQKHERFPIVCADKPVGEWNTFYIKMVGERVTVKLNGQLVTDNVVMENYWERDEPIYPTGQIELQNHGNTLWFKNIYIRELE